MNSSSRGEPGYTASRHTRHSSIGGIVISSWSRSLARSTCHGDTGRDWASQSCLPSSETEGAVVSFMALSRHRTKASSTGMAPDLSGKDCDTSSSRSRPCHRRKPEASTRNNVPKPQLSI